MYAVDVIRFIDHRKILPRHSSRQRIAIKMQVSLPAGKTFWCPRRTYIASQKNSSIKTTKLPSIHAETKPGVTLCTSLP
jgi:hypothetical protein